MLRLFLTFWHPEADEKIRNINLTQAKSASANQILHLVCQPGESGEQYGSIPGTVELGISTTGGMATATRQEVVHTQPTSSVDRFISLKPGRRLAQPQVPKLVRQRFRRFPNSARLRSFLESYVEPISIKSDYIYLYNTRYASLALRLGPLIVKRFSQDYDEIYEVSSDDHYGIGISFQFPWYYLGRITLALFAKRQTHQYLNFSLQWNISFPGVVPTFSPIMKLARKGDLVGMETLFEAGEASPTDVMSDGTSLLHVRNSPARTLGFGLMFYRSLPEQIVSSLLSIS